MSGLKSAVFLDRDGTVIREYGHFWEPNQIQLIPGAAGAIRRLKAAGFLAVLATNQSGIARGIFTSTTDLRRKLMHYIRTHNKHCHPFVWNYSDPTRRIRAGGN